MSDAVLIDGYETRSSLLWRALTDVPETTAEHDAVFVAGETVD